MKKILVLSILLAGAASMDAQVRSTFFQASNAFQTYPALESISTAVPVKQMSTVNVDSLLAEDQELAGLDVPFRFGYGFDVSYTLEDGVWEDAGDVNIWSLKIASPGAYSLNFIFDKLSLAYGAELYIYSADGTMVYGPVTAVENLPEAEATSATKESGKLFLTDLVAGDAVIIRLFEPANIPKPSVLRISRVVHGYVNMFSSLQDNGNALMAAALTCHNNVACYSDWQNESDAVALVLLASGAEWCSGALVNNTGQNFTPYFLSAYHCLDVNKNGTVTTTERNDSQNWSYRFGYKKTTCNGSTVASYVSYNGATYRAGWAPTDFLLMQLNFSGKYTGTKHSYLGWDRTASTPTSGTGIHHPQGDLMKISFSNQSLIKNPLSINWSDGTISPANSHWQVELTNGTTEGGSSGGPLFNQNKKVIGQVHGGYSGCPPITKYFGAFDNSWTGGGTNDTRLSNWLDPNGTGTTTTSLIRPSVPSHSYNFPSALYPGNNSFSVTCLSCVSGKQNWTVHAKVSPGYSPQYEWRQVGESNTGNGYIELSNTDVYINNTSYGPCAIELLVTTWVSGQIYSESTHYVPCLNCNLSTPCSNDSSFLSASAAVPVISAYPNPATNVLNIAFEETGQQLLTGTAIDQTPQIFDICLFNMMGMKVLQTATAGAEVVQLNVSNLPNGIYTLNVYDGTNNPPQTRQIIISH
jgi:hypothetical protein